MLATLPLIPMRKQIKVCLSPLQVQAMVQYMQSSQPPTRQYQQSAHLSWATLLTSADALQQR